MPNQIVDQRDATLVYEGGSDLLQIYVDATAAAALPVWASAGTGWYNPAWLQGGSWGHNPEGVEKIKSESGSLIRERVTDDKYFFRNTFLQSDDETLAVLEYFQDNAFKMRYFSPTLPSTPDSYQVVGYYNCLILKQQWEISTEESALHSLAFEIEATVDSDGNTKVFETITDINSEAGWPSTLDAFLTDESSWPT